MGSGGSHALWPVTQLFASRLFFKRFGQHEVHHPDYLVRVPAAVDAGPRVPELVEAIEPLPPDVVGVDVSQALPAQAGDGDAGLEPAVPFFEPVLAAYLDVGAAHPSGLRLLAAEDLDEERSLEEKSH
jgi:hypothetical protein